MIPMMDMSRRQFCIAGGAAAIAAAAGGVGFLARESAEAVYLRPPGTESEADLLAKCDRCQRCVQVCPYDRVQPRLLSLDFPTVGTPELVFKNGYCDFCMKCMEVCPTGALSPHASTARDIGVAKVISDACVAWDWQGCAICADECPVEGAIVLDDRGRPHVDEGLCDGCGLCERVCPAPSLRAYNSASAEKGVYVVSRCSQAAATAGAIATDRFRAGRYRKSEGSGYE